MTVRVMQVQRYSRMSFGTEHKKITAKHDTQVFEFPFMNAQIARGRRSRVVVTHLWAIEEVR